MSKASSRLASGIRKVKEQQPAAAGKRPASQTGGKPAVSPKPARPVEKSPLHPARVWPD